MGTAKYLTDDNRKAAALTRYIARQVAKAEARGKPYVYAPRQRLTNADKYERKASEMRRRLLLTPSATAVSPFRYAFQPEHIFKLYDFHRRARAPVAPKPVRAMKTGIARVRLGMPPPPPPPPMSPAPPKAPSPMVTRKRKAAKLPSPPPKPPSLRRSSRKRTLTLKAKESKRSKK